MMFRRRERDAERGQILPIVALSLVVLLGAASLAVDVGYLRYEQRIQQTAADSAALAGASELQYPSANDVVAAAKHDAALNGFPDDGTVVTVTVNQGPSSGPYQNNLNAVEVIVRKTYPLFFEKIFGISTQSVQTRAVGFLSNGALDCIYALNPSGTANMNAATINAPTCGLIADGMLNMNSATVDMAAIGAAGLINANASTFAHAHPAHASAVGDPCPNISGCAYLAANPPATTPCTYSGVSENAWTGTLNPGVYCGALNLNASTVTFNPGVYVITGGFNGNASNLIGTGVTFVIASGNLNVNAAGINLTAPMTGNTKGILFYQPSSNASSANLNASGSSSVAGALYFPSATLNSNASFGTWLMLIAGDFNMNAATITVPHNAVLPGTQKGVVAE